jgi:hypothetical protein
MSFCSLEGMRLNMTYDVYIGVKAMSLIMIPYKEVLLEYLSYNLSAFLNFEYLVLWVI